MFLGRSHHIIKAPNSLFILWVHHVNDSRKRTTTSPNPVRVDTQKQTSVIKCCFIFTTMSATNPQMTSFCLCIVYHLVQLSTGATWCLHKTEILHFCSILFTFLQNVILHFYIFGTFLASPIRFKLKFCRIEECCGAQHEF